MFQVPKIKFKISRLSEKYQNELKKSLNNLIL